MRYAPEKAQPYLFHQIIQLGKAVVLLMLFLMACRLMFIGLFTELVVLKKNLGLTFEAMFLGMRYDLIPIAYLVSVPYLLVFTGFIFPREGWLRGIANFNRVWLSLGFLLLLAIAVCDLGFYSHFQDHINVLFFGLWEDDTMALLTSINKNYRLWLWLPMLSLLSILYIWGFFHLFRRERIDLFYARPIPREELGLVFVAGLVILVFLGRGNFTRLPLSIEDAYISDIESLNELSVNGVIALNRAMRVRREFGKENVRHLHAQGYQSPGAAAADVLIYRGMSPESAQALGVEALRARTPENTAVAALHPHVVVFMMESFGSFWWPQQEQIPFLDAFATHVKEDTLFLNFLSSENGTIGSFVAIASGLPLRPGARFLSEGEYLRTPLASDAHLPYKKAGYTTRFLYGGKLGWRQLGAYLQNQGWDVLEGADQLKEVMDLESKIKPVDLGNEWGLYDEYLFQHVQEELAKATTPQFFLVLSTSNHPPYETPSTFKPTGLQKLSPEMQRLMGRSPDDVLKRFRTLQYANRKLGEFMTSIKSSALKDNTVVAVTGDHSFWVGKDEGRPGLVRKYGVPFYLYLPKSLRPAQWDPTRWGSHVDIMPTLYNRTLSSAEYWAFGVDLFSTPGAAVNAFGIVAGTAGAVMGGNSYCWKGDPSEHWLQGCPSDPQKEILRNYQRGIIGLTDEFLREHVTGKIKP